MKRLLFVAACGMAGALAGAQGGSQGRPPCAYPPATGGRASQVLPSVQALVCARKLPPSRRSAP